MTDKQTEALRSLYDIAGDVTDKDTVLVGRAEFHRLHAENEDFRATCDQMTRENAGQIGEIVALKEQRDELMAALKLLEEAYCADDYGTREGRAKGRAALIATRAAIAKAGGAA